MSSNSSKNKKLKWRAGDYLFWGGVIFTVVWCYFLWELFTHRTPDFAPLFEPAPSTAEAKTPLTLNEIGDTLAGVFAPLAFLWFFISTWLQRSELNETRQVMIDQQIEMEKSARESAQQTSIMQEQLATARSRDVFEEHRLQLYYLARYIHDRVSSLSIAFVHGAHYSERWLYRTSEDSVLTEDVHIVDSVFIDMADAAKEVSLTPEVVEKAVGPDVLAANAEYIRDQLRTLLNNPAYIGNSLISSRVKGVGLEEVLEEIDKATQRLSQLQPTTQAELEYL